MVHTISNWSGFEWVLTLGLASLVVLGWFAVINAIYHNK
jgi:hypothetical protein